jgi:hypothetical protein
MIHRKGVKQMKRRGIIALTLIALLSAGSFAIAHWTTNTPAPNTPQQLMMGMPMMMGRMHKMGMMGMYGRGDGMPMMWTGTHGSWGCPMMQQYGSNWQDVKTPLTKERATNIVQNYLKSTGNPNLKLGEVKETDAHFEVEIVTKDNSLVDKILVDKSTGWMRSAY